MEFKKSETELEALKRELIEESGYTIKNIQEFAKIGSYFYSETKGYIEVIANVYICEFDKKITNPVEKDHILLWVNPHDFVGKMCRKWQEYILKEFINNSNIE